MTAGAVLGWDIGGAHVKATLIEESGNVVQSWHHAAPVWKGLEYTERSVRAIRAQASSGPLRHAVTMTAELADIFPNRTEGVQAVASSIASVLGTEALHYFAGDQGFVARPREQALRIASCNWLASARWLEESIESGVLVDVGSTTTDLTAIRRHRARAPVTSDAERLACNMLLYTGAVRTPVMSLARKISWQGHDRNVVAEHFATTADVYCLLGRLPETMFPFETADGADCSPASCARRLARTVGMDCDPDDLEPWRDLAQVYADCQHALIVSELRAHGISSADVLVGAGSGRFLLPACASECGMSYVDVGSLLPGQDPNLPDCLAAFAVAELLRRIDGDS